MNKRQRKKLLRDAIEYHRNRWRGNLTPQTEFARDLWNNDWEPSFRKWYGKDSELRWRLRVLGPMKEQVRALGVEVDPVFYLF